MIACPFSESKEERLNLIESLSSQLVVSKEWYSSNTRSFPQENRSKKIPRRAAW
jgi:hypothetical protein